MECVGILRCSLRQPNLFFKLEKEFQSRSYDALISHTTIVFARFIVLSWQNRCNTDQRTIGGLFYDLCDEVNKLDWAITLQQLIELLQDALNRKPFVLFSFPEKYNLAYIFFYFYLYI